MTFKEGDKYVHFTKLGGVNRGEVKWVGESIHWDTVNGVAYYDPYIVTTKDFTLKLDGSDGKVYKLKEDVSEEDINKWKRSAEIFKNLKIKKGQHIKYKDDTEYLLSSEANAKRLDESIKQMNGTKDNIS